MSLDFSTVGMINSPSTDLAQASSSSSNAAGSASAGVIRRRKSKASTSDLIDLDNGIEDK